MRLDESSRVATAPNGAVHSTKATRVRWVVMGFVMAIMAVTALKPPESEHRRQIHRSGILL